MHKFTKGRYKKQFDYITTTVHYLWVSKYLISRICRTSNSHNFFSWFKY